MLLTNGKFTPVRADRTGRIQIRKTSHKLAMKDRIGGLLVRWDIGRNDYRVEPGLYACGNPNAGSPVLVSANYKLTFDLVRKELGGIDVWILVLDTKGVNVWCAAGKGTFGTGELLHRIKLTGLAKVVSHRDLILPQLGATGVAGYQVTKESGFRVHFGPVYARDLPEYIASGMKKTEGMRRVRFTLKERLAVAPVEIAHAWKLALSFAAAGMVFALPADSAFAVRLISNLVMLEGGILAGTLLFPALLPWIPFRAFSAKGALLGAAWCAAVSLAVMTTILSNNILSGAVGLLPASLVTISAVSFLSMNYTGSSTFTCQKGAELEVKRSVIPQIAGAAAGFAAGIALVVCRAFA
jgi:hypothetical protein